MTTDTPAIPDVINKHSQWKCTCAHCELVEVQGVQLEALLERVQDALKVIEGLADPDLLAKLVAQGQRNTARR